MLPSEYWLKSVSVPSLPLVIQLILSSVPLTPSIETPCFMFPAVMFASIDEVTAETLTLDMPSSLDVTVCEAVLGSSDFVSSTYGRSVNNPMPS